MRRTIVLLALLAAWAMPAVAAAQSVVTAEIGSITRTVYGAGQVQSASMPGVYAGTDAAVAEWTVGVGDSVKAGDVIGYLTDAELDAEIEQLELDAQKALEALADTKTYEMYTESVVRDERGRPVKDEETGEAMTVKSSNEITIRAPAAGRIMAIYIEPGDDALAVYREKGAVMMLSTDGRMKVELRDVECDLALGDAVRVKGEGIEAEGRVVNLTHRGTRATVEVIGDTYPMDAAVSVYDEGGALAGEGVLEINKPLAVSAYGGTVKGIMWNVKVGAMVERQDALARLVWDEMPLYIGNDEAVYAYARANAMLSDALARRESLTLTAPVDGVIACIDVSEGEDVTAGTRLLSLVEDGAGMTLVLKVDELDIVSVAPGQSVSLTADALPEMTLGGMVEKIAPIGDTSGAVTTFDVYVTLTGEIDERVRGGMNMSGEIAVESAQGAVTLPAEALQKDAQGWYVTMEDGSRRDVRVGIMTDGRVQITGGLDAGERIICRT